MDVTGYPEARAALPVAAWRALQGALEALLAGGLPCGAALADHEGAVIASGRNHAYDAPSADDVLEGTPLAHAELNVLARVPTGRDLSGDVLWSTQQPCAMCSAALRFCGVGEVRWLAADPAFVGADDPRGGPLRDPTPDDATPGPWAVLANVLFLQPSIARGGRDDPRIVRNLRADPATTELALEVAAERVRTADLDALAGALWPRLAVAARRRAGVGRSRPTNEDVVVRGLRWVGVATRSYDEMVHLLRDVLGLRPAFTQDTTAEFSTADGDRVQLMAPGDAYHDFFTEHARGPVPLFEVDDVDAARAALQRAGIQIVGTEGRDRHWRWIHVRAPDGNLYELASRLRVTR